MLRLEGALVPMSVSHVAECPDLGPQCFDDTGAATQGVRPLHHPGHGETRPYNHHLDQLMGEAIFSASLGITPYFGLETRWSLRITHVDASFSELDGTPKEVPGEIHHRDETLVDVADPWLLGRVGGAVGDFTSLARLGLSFPLGRTEPDPYRAGRRGESHQHLQGGTGTFVPILGAGVSYTIAPVTLGLGGVAFFSLYENHHGYRAPSRFYLTQRTTVSVLEGVLAPFAEVSLAHVTEEYWQGLAGLEGTNVRTELYLGGGLAWRFADTWSLDGSVSGRVANFTEGASFDTYGLFRLGVSKSFSLWDDDDDEATIEERREGDVIEFEKK